MYEIDPRLINADGSINHDIARELACKARAEALGDYRRTLSEAARGVIGALRRWLAATHASEQPRAVASQR